MQKESDKERRQQMIIEERELMELAVSSSKKKVKRKKVKKVKVNKPTLIRAYDSKVGAEFPIYVFNHKGIRLRKLSDREAVLHAGLHLGTVLTCVRDMKLHHGSYFSYNKAIN